MCVCRPLPVCELRKCTAEQRFEEKLLEFTEIFLHWSLQPHRFRSKSNDESWFLTLWFSKIDSPYVQGSLRINTTRGGVIIQSISIIGSEPFHRAVRDIGS